jgi:hypothetical protein
VSDVTLELKFRISGTLTNATSVLLSDPDGVYGVKRLDTDATVVADGTAMTNVNTGIYRYTFTAPATGLEYSWWAEVLHEGTTYRFEREYTDLASYAEWHYADYGAVADILGTSDLTIIADPDNDGAVNYDLVQRAGEHADALMDAKFAAAGFTVPLAGTTAADDLILRDINAKLTIAQLNRSRALVVVSRGNTTQVAGVDRVMMTWEREAWSMLSSIVHGDVSITADRANAVASAPVPAFTTYFVPPLFWR